MTSAERKESRRIRRSVTREAQKQAAVGECDSLEKVADLNALMSASKKARSGITWKASVQRYLMNLLKNVADTHKKILSEEDVRRGFIKFDLIERGKLRHISSVHFSERVAQRSLCANALIPTLTRGLIYDNGASLKNKGITFALDRLSAHLQRHYRKHGNEGYVLLLDFSDYFGRIRHDVIKEILNQNFKDKRLISLAMSFVYAFGEKGLGLGSETSQIFAVTYPSKIDHYIKEVLRIKGYARYMDDSYLIHKDKGYLKKCLEDLKGKFAEVGIVLNPKKTRIVKLSKGFTFLKTQYFLTDTGKVIRKACRESIVRQRRKLKKFKKFSDAGEMSFDHIYNSYMSWRGYIGHKDAHRTILSMDKLFRELFTSKEE
jgi:RNA-directed DNA polymerase